MRHLIWGPFACAVAATPACDTLRELKASLEGSEGGLGTAQLRVEVEPADGITILLDGVRVASMSPYVNEHVKAGSHELEVRAMGYHAFVLPIELEDYQSMTVPVALRRRPPGSPEPHPRPSPSPPADAPPEPPPAIQPNVPPGVKPIALTVAVRPAAPLTLDGEAVAGRSLTLDRVSGTLGFGEATLPYRIGGRGLLFYSVPDDGARWSFDGRALETGARFKHFKGVARIERTTESGTVTVLINR